VHADADARVAKEASTQADFRILLFLYHKTRDLIYTRVSHTTLTCFGEMMPSGATT
jgi:hypothetical protein